MVPIALHGGGEALKSRAVPGDATGPALNRRLRAKPHFQGSGDWIGDLAMKHSPRSADSDGRHAAVDGQLHAIHEAGIVRSKKHCDRRNFLRTTDLSARGGISRLADGPDPK